MLIWTLLVFVELIMFKFLGPSWTISFISTTRCHQAGLTCPRKWPETFKVLQRPLRAHLDHFSSLGSQSFTAYVQSLNHCYIHFLQCFSSLGHKGKSGPLPYLDCRLKSQGTNYDSMSQWFRTSIIKTRVPVFIYPVCHLDSSLF